MEGEPKLGELLEAVKDGFGLMGRRFDALEGRMDRLEGRMDNLDGRMDRLEGRMDNLDGRMGRQEGKLNMIVNVLHEKHVITEDDERNIHA